MEIMSKELWVKTVCVCVCTYVHICMYAHMCMIMSQPGILGQQKGWNWDRMEKRRK